MDINRKEIYRYLGYGSHVPDENTVELVEKCIEELLKCISPRCFYRNYPMKVTEDGVIDIGCMQIRSKNLLKNVSACQELILFAASLGTGPDFLIERYKRISMSKAVVVQAAAAAMIEAYCNEVNDNLKQEYRAKGMFLRPRFSPGYGDFPLETQRELDDILKLEKTVGITLTDSCLMLPSKSVTAVIGVGKEDVDCSPSGCEVCGKTDCAYRRV